MFTDIKKDAQEQITGVRVELVGSFLVYASMGALLGMMIVTAFVGIGLIYMGSIYALNFVRNEDRTLNFDQLGKCTGTAIFMSLIAFAGALGLGLLLFLFIGVPAFIGNIVVLIIGIILGVILGFLYILALQALFFAVPFIIYDTEGEATTREILSISVDMMKRNIFKHILFKLSFIGHFLLCVITLGIYSIYFLPYYNVAKANFYDECVEEYKDEYACTYDRKLLETRENSF